jgi:hypothetical protein
MFAASCDNAFAYHDLQDGDTPAICAAWKGKDACLRMLVTSGADLNVQNKVWDTRSHSAAKNKCIVHFDNF